MATIDILDVHGKKSGSRDLPSGIFEATVSVPLMHQVVVAGLAGLRAGTHSTKTRGDVRGGGKKPWRQKGTGVAHGPQPHGHEMRVNKKMKRGAIRSALTDALQSGKLAVIDELSFDGPKTADAARLLRALELDGKVLLVLAEPHDTVERSFRNIASVRIAYAPSLGVYEVIAADRVLFTAAALDVLDAKEAAA